jgi:hypothetical protein
MASKWHCMDEVEGEKAGGAERVGDAETLM